MKPLAIVALWTFLGWDLGAWAESLTGVPAVVGLVGGVVAGVVLAVEAQKQIAAAAARRAAAPTPLAPAAEVGPALDIAA